MLSREQILAIDDLQRIEVQIPEWGGSVYVRILTSTEREWLITVALDAEGNILPAQQRLQSYRARVAALSACNADGSSLFMLSDIEALGHKSGKAIDRIVEAAEKLNAMGIEEIDALAKNSVATIGVASGSDSP